MLRQPAAEYFNLNVDMNRYFLQSLFVLFLSAAVGKGYAQGYSISVKLTPVKNEILYLGYYYGNKKALADSALVNEQSVATFKGDTALPGGIYFVVSAQKEILFELLIDDDQDFSIEANRASIQQSVRFSGSKINEQFQQYAAFSATTGREINNLKETAEKAQDPQEAETMNAIARSLTQKLQAYRDSIIDADPEGFLSLLFKAMKEPQVPPASMHPGGKYDSAFAFNVYKQAYWNGISFDDARLLRTPFFEAKLEKYYRDLVNPDPDSVIAEIDYMLLYARSAPEMFQFLIVHFVQKYVNPQYMGQDAVFVHLFEKYINTGMTPFFTSNYRDYLDKRAYSLMANLIGQPAANLDMVTLAGTSTPLYNVKADYTVVVFWDPTCGHCKEVLPKVDSIYNAKWKNEGVKIYAVKVDGPNTEWTKFINDNKLQHWTHVYQTPEQASLEEKAGRPNFRQLYDVYMTPALYLLDKDKRIIAKKLSYLQLDDVINLKKNSK